MMRPNVGNVQVLVAMCWCCVVFLLSNSSNAFVSVSIAFGSSVRVHDRCQVEESGCGSSSSSSSPWCLSLSRNNPESTVPVPEVSQSKVINPVESTHTKNENTDEKSAFFVLANLAFRCLLESERRRDAIGKEGGLGTGSSATNWIDERTSFHVKQALDRLELNWADRQPKGPRRDEAGAWLRWMKRVPAPLYVELDDEFRREVNEGDHSEYLRALGLKRAELLRRLSLRLVLFPSGGTLRKPLSTPTPGGITFGKLLYGGVKRYRVLGGSRRTSERTATKPTPEDKVPAWVQYGGSGRTYEALDVGPAAVLEITLHPLGKPVLSLREEQQQQQQQPSHGDGVLSRLAWSPQDMFTLRDDEESSTLDNNNKKKTVSAVPNDSLSGKDRNDSLESSFSSSLGGLKPQIQTVIRRVLDGRIVQSDSDSTLSNLEASTLASLGLVPVRGLLFYGPPGCGIRRVSW